MRIFFSSIIIVLLNLHLLYAQDLDYTLEVIDTLTSSYMAGRGYVQDGHNKAASYIKNQFEQIGLKPVSNEFYQKFSFPINTFQGEISLLVDNQNLIPGKDYLIGSDSPSIKGKYKLVYVDSIIKTNNNARKIFFKKKYSHSFLVIDLKTFEGKQNKSLLDSLEENSCNADGVILLEPQKLTWHPSQSVNKFPSLFILKSAMPTMAKNISVSFTNTFIKNLTSQNIVGFVKGKEYPDSFIVLTAHYDHLGMMGDSIYFPGANDNASGTSMLLNLAKYYSLHSQKYSICFIAFSAEEVGLVGSKYFSEHPLFSLSNIKFLLNMDLLGTGDDGLMVVNGKTYPDLYDSLVSINNLHHYLPEIKSRGKAANSDHYWFTEKGVKSFFIYTLGGITAYHDIYDKAETLPLTKYPEVYKLITDFIETLLE